MTKLRPPLQRADSPLLRMWGRTLSVYADMPTMNIHISLKFHAVCTASSVVKLQRFGTERDIPTGRISRKKVRSKRSVIDFLGNEYTANNKETHNFVTIMKKILLQVHNNSNYYNNQK